MSATDSSSDVDTEHNGETPPKDDNNPLVRKWSRGVVCAYVSKEENGRHYAVTEENQDHRAKELSNRFAKRTGVRGWRGYRSRCHKCSLLFCVRDKTENSEVRRSIQKIDNKTCYTRRT